MLHCTSDFGGRKGEGEHWFYWESTEICDCSSLHTSLENFVQENDSIVFGTFHQKKTSLQNLRELVNIHVTNSYPSVEALHTHLESLNLLDQEHLRPSWDAYFMVRTTHFVGRWYEQFE